MFEEEKNRLEKILPDSSVIEHIGSTAVHGLAAKPIIDIMVGLTNFAVADSLVPSIEGLGYEYVYQFESEMSYRRYFRKEKAGVRTYHIHMVAIASDFWNRHLSFRDYLRTHPDTATEYANLKRNLSNQEWQDMNDYAAAKTGFILSIEAKAS
jgi:GrpB-like predicted nucleotidyltransferase (UPF0157 family)